MTIFEAVTARGGVAVPGNGRAVWITIQDRDGLADEAAINEAIAEAGYIRVGGPHGDYFVPARDL